MKRAVLTGATGMLGATLVRELLSHGWAVLALARPGSPKKANLPQHPKLLVLEVDLDGLARVTPDALATAAKNIPDDAAPRSERQNLFAPPYDCCYHFAWNGTYGAARNDLYTQQENIRHTLDALSMAARLGCAKFVGAGSQAEYGRVPEGVMLTPQTPTNPVSGYGAAKLAAGLLGAMRAHQLGMRFTWVRVLSVYGPMDNEFTVTISTIRKLLRGEHVAFTKGDQIWDFLYSDDAARAFRLIGERSSGDAVYVLGSGRTIRLADAFRLLAAAVSPQADFGFGELPYRTDQCMYLSADISALTRDVGFAPLIDYPEGIRNTVAWCLQNPR